MTLFGFESFSACLSLGFSALWFACFHFFFFFISPSCEEGLSRSRKLTLNNLRSLQRNIKQHGFVFSNMSLAGGMQSTQRKCSLL